jgi:hypothetical protein
MGSPSELRTTLRIAAMHAAALVLVRLGVSAAVRAAGFHSLSDDDFARISIAQAFAHSPKLDPTGTSWLPAPFWAEGGAMMAVGRSLGAAHAFSAAMSCGALVLLYGCARAAGVSARASFAGAAACAVMPVAALVGAAPVPDFGVAAMSASALLLLRAPDARWLGAMGVILLAATLSRYEPWSAAFAAAALALIPGTTSRQDTRRARRWRIAGAVLALAGPLLWIGWNAHAHGHAFAFHARVSSYRDAVASGAGLRAWVMGYPAALVRDAPPIAAVGAVAIALLRERDRLKTWARPVAGALFMVAALLGAELVGGAPTHHPDRTLLAPWFVLWLASADLLDRSLGDRRGAGWIAAAAVIVFDVARTAWIVPYYGQDRRDDVEAGLYLRGQGAEAVLIEPVDYGYFAVIAAYGKPEEATLTHTIDPRIKLEAPSLRVRAAGAKWIVARESYPELGVTTARFGKWTIMRASEDGK